MSNSRGLAIAMSVMAKREQQKEAASAAPKSLAEQLYAKREQRYAPDPMEQIAEEAPVEEFEGTDRKAILTDIFASLRRNK